MLPKCSPKLKRTINIFKKVENTPHKIDITIAFVDDEDFKKMQEFRDKLEKTRCQKCGSNLLVSFDCSNNPKNPSCLCGYTNIKGIK